MKNHIRKGGSVSQTSTKSQATAFVGKFNDQKRNKFRGNSNLQCKNCGLKGHTIERCYKLIGFPKDFKFKNESQNPNKTLSSNNSMSSNNLISSDLDVKTNNSSEKFFSHK